MLISYSPSFGYIIVVERLLRGLIIYAVMVYFYQVISNAVRWHSWAEASALAAVDKKAKQNSDNWRVVSDRWYRSYLDQPEFSLVRNQDAKLIYFGHSLVGGTALTLLFWALGSLAGTSPWFT